MLIGQANVGSTCSTNPHFLTREGKTKRAPNATESIEESLLDQERRRERALPSLLDEGACNACALVIKWEGEGH